MRRVRTPHAVSSAVAAVALLLTLGACNEPTAPPRVTGLILTPLNDTLAIGSTEQFAVTAIGESGSTLSGVRVDWSTSAPDVATVSGSGLVTAVAAGVATITATSGEISRSATVVVRPPDCGAPSAAGIVLGTARDGAMTDSPCLLFDEYTATGFPLVVDGSGGLRLQLAASGFAAGLVITDSDNLGIIGFPPGTPASTLRAVLLPGNYRVWVLSSAAPSAAQTFTLNVFTAGGACEGTPVARTLDLGLTAAAAVTHDSCVLLGGPSAEGWRVLLTEPTTLRVSATSAAFAPTVAITDVDYTTIISFRIGSAPGTAATTAVLPAGEYYVWGGSFNFSTGTVQVTAEEVAPCAASGSLTLGVPTNAQLEATDCFSVSRSLSYADVWTLTLAETTTVDITLNSTAFDAYLELRGSDDALIVANDDDEATLNSRIVRSLAPGTYRIWATSYAGAVTGAYTLTAAEAAGGGALRLERAAKRDLSSPWARPGWPATRP